MKNSNILKALTIFMLSMTLNSCAVVEGIFKTGMGVGIFIVVAIVAIVGIIVVNVRGGGKSNP
jgi:hypothetical protein